MTPLVTTLVITYNQLRFLPELLDGLLAQTYTNQEIIISDDASSDQSELMLLAWQLRLEEKFSRVKIILNQQNLGLQGRNNIASLTQHISPESEFVQILEGDDYWMPYKTSVLVKQFRETPEYGCIHANFWWGKSKINRWEDWGRCWSEPPSGWVKPALIGNNFIMTCTAMFRTELYKKHANYDLFTERGYILGDYALCLSLSNEAQIGYIKNYVAHYRSHPDSTTQNPETRAKIIENTALIQQHANMGLI